MGATESAAQRPAPMPCQDTLPETRINGCYVLLLSGCVCCIGVDSDIDEREQLRACDR
jgi:hypothetical protein